MLKCLQNNDTYTQSDTAYPCFFCFLWIYLKLRNILKMNFVKSKIYSCYFLS